MHIGVLVTGEDSFTFFRYQNFYYTVRQVRGYSSPHMAVIIRVEQMVGYPIATHSKSIREGESLQLGKKRQKEEEGVHDRFYRGKKGGVGWGEILSHTNIDDGYLTSMHKCRDLS